MIGTGEMQLQTEVPYRRWIRINWGARSETAGAIAERLLHWVNAVSTLPGVGDLRPALASSRKATGDKPLRLLSKTELLPILRGIMEGRPPQSAEEVDRLGFGIPLHALTIPTVERLTLDFSAGSANDFMGNTTTLGLPRSVAFQQPREWHLCVLQSLIEAFDPDDGADQAWLRHLHPHGTALEAEPIVTRNFLRWDSGRRPIQPPIDVPIPPPLSRPWLGGTLYEWPEHAALVGATPD
jgi:hypothetical protein